MNRTIDYAKNSECHQRHAALVYKGGRVYRVAVNKIHNDPKMFPDNIFNENYMKISTHAEENAMRGVCDDVLRGSTVYVARVSPGGSIALSKPCTRCEKALIDKGVKKVIYTDFVEEENELTSIAA